MIFNLQRYSTHDGPGIRTVVFLKGCSLGCFWCQNPESQSAKQEILFDERLCMNDCDLCSASCPNLINKSNGHIRINRKEFEQADYKKMQNICPSLALTVCGESLSVQEVMQTINKDNPFYQRSGGGVTLSGGEPFMQPKLSQEILAACKQQSYHTAVETCLHVPWKNIEASLPYLDLFLADLKHTDESIFYAWTKGSAKRILKNFQHLANANKKITVRVPLIQGFNADEKSIKSIVDFVASEIPTDEIHFLPYHTLGVNKYKMLDLPYYAPKEPLNDANIIDFATNYSKQKQLTAVLRG